MRIYTRTGDGGETGLLGSLRVRKDHIRIAAYGEIDELNAQIGLLRIAADSPEIDSRLARIQGLLLEIGTELAGPPGSARPAGAIREADVADLESEIDRLEADLPPLHRFLLPGGSEAAGRAHLARCVCRRAERAVVHLLRAEPSETFVLQYLNRLSDFLFVLARWLNRQANVAEPDWTSRGSA
jgi:cob(I)alamin adenosyltransferase